MNRYQARYAGGVAGSVAGLLLTLVGLYLSLPPRNTGEAGPQRWLLLGGACGLPVSLFYGWVVGAYLAGKVVK